MPVYRRSKRRGTKTTRGSNLANYYAKGIARNARFVGKNLAGALRGTAKSAKYLPIVGGLMNQQYDAYEQYVNSRRVLKPRAKSNRTGGQWSSSSASVNLSKPMTTSQKVAKLVNANKQKVIFRWNAIRPYGDGRGYYWLSNIEGTPLTRNLPLHTFDITSCINVSSTSSTIRRAQPACFMYQDIPSGDINFINTSGTRADGTTTDVNLQMEYSSAGGDASVSSPNDAFALPLSKDLLKWVSIKLNCYGTKNQATKYSIMLVRFTDRDLVPHSSISANAKRTSLFQSMIKTLTYNPIAVTQTHFSKRMVVLKKESFVIQDQTSDSLDTDPHNRTINWFVRLNKICNYSERAQTLATADTNDEADFVVNVGQQNNEYVQPTSRVFLLVMASNYGKDETETTATTPSFDVVIRMCHENFN